MQYLQIPYLQFRSNSIIKYTLPENQNFRTKVGADGKTLQQSLTANLIKAETYTGLLKPGAKKRMIKAIEMLVMLTRGKEKKAMTPKGKIVKFRLNFTTLTIYSTDRNISGKEAHKRCLEPFLQWMRRVHGCKLYVWKAEHQKRGQIHYHITCDTFLPKDQVTAKWNALQKEAGYLDSFFDKYGRWDAASTKVHKVRRESRLAGYLTKEFTKSYQNEKSIEGKVWDCSMNLKAGQYFTTCEDSDYHHKLGELIAQKKIEAVITDTCVIFKLNDTPLHNVLSDSDRRGFSEWVDGLTQKEIEIKPKNKYEIVDRNNKFTLADLYTGEIVDFIPQKIINILPIPDLFSPS